MDLIRRCRAGDEEAFAALFHQHKNLVYKTAFLMLGDADDAEDALQEVFVKVHRSLAAYEPSRGAFTTWLHRITVNHCLSWKRKHRLTAISLERISPARLIAEATLPKRIDDGEMIGRALGRLSGKLRAAVILRHYWGLSYAEMAEVLNVPIGTIRSRLNLALKQLRKELQTCPYGLSESEVAR